MWVAVAKYTDWVILNSRNFLLTVLKAGKSKIKVPRWSLAGEGHLLVQSQHLCAVSPGVEGAKDLSKTSLIRALILFRACQVALVVKNPTANAGDIRDAVFLPGESHGQRSLVAHTHLYTHTLIHTHVGHTLLHITIFNLLL